ncbi:hypothetical protein PVAP13_2NG268603 [Panicum virgatum]|uniref:Uncharacterized protein n=1 Tax=Panicum virgatum TaxID=38727 RepID=A0A8T0VG24_PANVG|nr:hypothetical protein PVAP13_2NG268603 [Panicum virgatum]
MPGSELPCARALAMATRPYCRLAHPPLPCVLRRAQLAHPPLPCVLRRARWPICRLASPPLPRTLGRKRWPSLSPACTPLPRAPGRGRCQAVGGGPIHSIEGRRGASLG